MKDLNPQCPIEPDRGWNVVGGELNRVDALDHRLTSPVPPARRRDPASNAAQFGSRSTDPVSLARQRRAQIWPSFERQLSDLQQEAFCAQSKDPFAPHLVRCYVCFCTTHAGA